MDKEELKQIRYIKTEIEAIERQIDNLEPLSATDKVSGSSNHFPYTQRNFKIEGIDDIEYNKKIHSLQKKLKCRKGELADKLIEMNEFIESIDDSLVRQIITLRYVECKTWTKIATTIGNNNTADSIRMILNRFFQNK